MHTHHARVIEETRQGVERLVRRALVLDGMSGVNARRECGRFLGYPKASKETTHIGLPGFPDATRFALRCLF